MSPKNLPRTTQNWPRSVKTSKNCWNNSKKPKNSVVSQNNNNRSNNQSRPRLPTSRSAVNSRYGVREMRTIIAMFSLLNLSSHTQRPWRMWNCWTSVLRLCRIPEAPTTCTIHPIMLCLLVSFCQVVFVGISKISTKKNMRLIVSD